MSKLSRKNQAICLSSKKDSTDSSYMFLQEKSIEYRNLLYTHPELGLDYNFQRSRHDKDHRVYEKGINNLNDNGIFFKYISHRQLIIKFFVQSLSLTLSSIVTVLSDTITYYEEKVIDSNTSRGPVFHNELKNTINTIAESLSAVWSDSDKKKDKEKKKEFKSLKPLDIIEKALNILLRDKEERKKLFKDFKGNLPVREISFEEVINRINKNGNGSIVFKYTDYDHLTIDLYHKRNLQSKYRFGNIESENMKYNPAEDPYLTIADITARISKRIKLLPISDKKKNDKTNKIENNMKENSTIAQNNKTLLSEEEITKIAKSVVELVDGSSTWGATLIKHPEIIAESIQDASHNHIKSTIMDGCVVLYAADGTRTMIPQCSNANAMRKLIENQLKALVEYLSDTQSVTKEESATSDESHEDVTPVNDNDITTTTCGKMKVQLESQRTTSKEAVDKYNNNIVSNIEEINGLTTLNIDGGKRWQKIHGRIRHYANSVGLKGCSDEYLFSHMNESNKQVMTEFYKKCKGIIPKFLAA